MLTPSHRKTKVIATTKEIVMKNNNGDLPAMPVLHTIDGNWNKEPIDDYKGLSKREKAAFMAMQGILANEFSELAGWTDWCEGIADHSVKLADALLAELDKDV